MDRCPKCRTYPQRDGCECPVAFLDRLGYTACVACVPHGDERFTEPLTRHAMSHGDRCDSCGLHVLPEPVSA